MFYAILAYHVEDTVQSWTPEEDAALMKDLLEVNDRLTREGRLGPAARLGATGTTRGSFSSDTSPSPTWINTQPIDLLRSGRKVGRAWACEAQP